MKKIIALLLCLIFSFAIFAGCGNKETTTSNNTSNTQNNEEPTEVKLTPEDILDNALTAWQSVETFKLKAITTNVITVQGQSVTTIADLECLYDLPDDKSYSKTTMNQSGQTTTVEMYANKEESGYTVYLSNNGEWYKQSFISNDVSSRNGITPEFDETLSIYIESCKANSTFEETSDYYVFESVLDSSDFETLKSSALKDNINSLLELGMTESELNELLLGMGEYEYTIYIDKETFIPTKLEADMNDAMGTLVSELYKRSGYDLEISVDKAVMSVTYSNFNEDFEITVPSEALSATEFELFK